MDPRPPPRPPQALLLDLDGTLVDTEWLHHETAVTVLQRHGAHLSAEEFAPYVGWAELPFWEDLRARFALPAPAAELVRARSDEFLRRLHGTRIRPLAGATELLAWAEETGVPVAVASSSPRALIEASLQASGLRPQVRAWRSGHEDAARGKPHPDVYLAAAAAVDADPARSVAVEDSPTGAAAARAAGAFVFTVPSPSAAARPEDSDARVADLHAVVEALRGNWPP